MTTYLMEYTLQQYFFAACLFWCLHRIFIEGMKIIIGYIEARLEKKLFEIPEIFLCGRCFTFWFLLIGTFNPITAAVVAVLVHFIDSVFIYLGVKTPIK